MLKQQRKQQREAKVESIKEAIKDWTPAKGCFRKNCESDRFKAVFYKNDVLKIYCCKCGRYIKCLDKDIVEAWTELGLLVGEEEARR